MFGYAKSTADIFVDVHISFAASVFQRPCIFNNHSDITPWLTTSVAPPARRMCNPYSLSSYPRSFSVRLNISLHLRLDLLQWKTKMIGCQLLICIHGRYSDESSSVKLLHY